MAIEHDLAQLLALPREQQLPAALALLARPTEPMPEAWNRRFGPDTLFAAWCRTSVCRAAHQAVRADLIGVLARPGFRVVDVGGGDGSLWRGLLRPEHRGEIVVVDPIVETHDQVRAAAPDGVRVHGIPARVEDATLPEADAIVCSLTLHHVAGRDAAERARHGLSGPGKREVLQAFARSLRPRGGVGILVEADVDCELDLPVGDPTLRDNLLDSYVRRCARSIVDDIHTGPAELVPRWRGLLQHWFLGQLAVADLPLAERDVYELTVPRWLDLLQSAGLTVEAHRFTDPLPLFHMYRFRC